MIDPTNWNADAEVGSFAFASPEEAKKAEAIMNKALKESFENGRLVALKECKAICEGMDDFGEWGQAASSCAAAIQFKIEQHYAAPSASSEEKKP